MRPGLMGTCKRSVANSLGRVETSFVDLPMSSSASIEAAAWLMAQPSPSQARFVILPSLTSICMVILSPQVGLYSITVAVGCASWPLW